jgi:hypothetical protein
MLNLFKSLIPIWNTEAMSAMRKGRKFFITLQQEFLDTTLKFKDGVVSILYHIP